jgi:hypothetical protein
MLCEYYVYLVNPNKYHSYGPSGRMLKYVPHERAIWILFGLNVIRYLLALEN